MNAEVRPVKTAAEIGLADLFASARQHLPGGSDTKAIRLGAFDRFVAQGLPHSRLEAWKYTDLRRLVRDAKPLSAPPELAAGTAAGNAGALFAGFGFRRLLIVDGAFMPELSDLSDLEAGISIRSTAHLLAADEPILSFGSGSADGDPAVVLNTALAADGVVITIDPNVVLERPIHLVYLTASGTPSAMFTRSRLQIGSGARVTLVETHEGPDQSDYQVNATLQLVIGDEARLDHVKVTGEGMAALHVATLLVEIGARTNYR
jgi:Fe-S cluster assembly protein SufD